jgi:GTPase SAR1 family protein
MPSLAEHQSYNVVKLLLLGNSKVGKTRSLSSLIYKYKLRILDMDNLLDPLKHKIVEDFGEEGLERVEYVTIRDKYKMTPAGPVIDGPPRAFIEAIKMLDNWRYGDVDLGRPAEWGPDCVLVIDSLSRLCDAAFDWREPLTPRGRSGEYDQRATYGDAQDAIEKLLAGLTSLFYNTNLILICHGVFQDQPDGTKKIFPQGVGQKLSPKIPQYFPNYIRYINQGGNRLIQLVSDPTIDLGVARPLKEKFLPAESGLLTLFDALCKAPPVAEKPQPRPVIFKRK